jgi:hypothetical protein
MRLTAHRLERLKRSLELALNQEWPKLSAATNHLAALHPTPIPIRPVQPSTLPVVATVATDGGENRLSLEPMQLQIVRVADSLGEIYFEDFIAQSLKPEEILRFFFESNDRLQRFLSYLKLAWEQLGMRFWPSSGPSRFRAIAISGARRASRLCCQRECVILKVSAGPLPYL